MKRFLILVCLLIACLRCNGSEGYRFEIEHDTDQRVQIAHVDIIDDMLIIEAVYHNTTDSTVYVRLCSRRSPDFMIEKHVDGAWIKAASPVCTLLPNPPIVIESGQHYRSTIRVWVIDLERDGTWRVTELPGRYRVVYGLYRTWEPENSRRWGLALPDLSRTSNAFRIID